MEKKYIYLSTPMRSNEIALGVTSLDLSSQRLAEIPWELQLLHSLTDLNLSNNMLIRIYRLPDLLSLNISNNNIRKLEGLSIRLQTLKASGNVISSMEGLQLCADLRFLEMANNHLEKISHLHRCTKLQHIGLALNKIPDISPLKACPLLQSIDISFNRTKLEGLEQLEHWPRLKRLELTSCQLTFLPPLHHTSLEYLAASYNPLTALPQPPDSLRSLYLSGTKIKEVPFMPGLEVLELWSQEEVRLTTMASSLRRLVLGSTSLSYKQLDALLPRYLEHFSVRDPTNATLQMEEYVNSGKRRKKAMVVEFLSAAFY